MQVRINYTRPGKGTTVYIEDLVADDGRRLTTYKALPPDISQQLTEVLLAQAMIRPDQTVAAIRKHYFYAEYFDLLEFIGPAGEVLGYYSDIATPLHREDGAFYVTDLFLDVWLAPGQPLLMLDEDEFAAAAAAGLMTGEEQAYARQAFERLRAEAAAGTYPAIYLGPRTGG
jgi:predicted RNA-binding protein associated with RNAse of E/G family